MDLRQIISARIIQLEVSQASVCRMAEIHETSLYRFLAGSTLRSDSLERVLDALKLKVVPGAA